MRSLGTFLCRHDFFWSERHGADRCRRCGSLRAADAPSSMSGGLAALLAADDSELSYAPAPPHAEALLEDWDNAPAAKSEPPVGLHGASLLARLESLIEGGELSRAQTIETLLAMIEDGQSSDPVVFGPNAAALFARLNSAR